MLETLLIVLAMSIIASVLQTRFKIPSPITLMVAVIAFSLSNHPMLEVNDDQFVLLVLLTLPLLIAMDALKLTWEDLKSNAASLTYAAGVMVLLSIFVGGFLKEFIVGHLDVSYLFILLLFCMVIPTDPVTVSAIFSGFKVPHKLKVLVEGESLFNDASALIVFGLALAAVARPDDVTAGFVAVFSLKVLAGSVLIGLSIGWLGSLALRFTNDAIIEAFTIIFAAYLAFWLAEHWHLSGILAIICATIILNIKIQAILRSDVEHVEEAEAKKSWRLLKFAVSTHENHMTITRNIEFAALLASTALFMSVAAIIDFANLATYWKETVAVFVACTVIRALMMLKFALLSQRVSFMQSIKIHWWAVMTFAGTKGAISILMVHMLPAGFRYKEMLETIVVGNVILSTFIFAPVLIGVFALFKERFAAEYAEEADH